MGGSYPGQNYLIYLFRYAWPFFLIEYHYVFLRFPSMNKIRKSTLKFSVYNDRLGMISVNVQEVKDLLHPLNSDLQGKMSIPMYRQYSTDHFMFVYTVL